MATDSFCGCLFEDSFLGLQPALAQVGLMNALALEQQKQIIPSPLWCPQCEMTLNSNDQQENHKTGKKHRDSLKLLTNAQLYCLNSAPYVRVRGTHLRSTYKKRGNWGDIMTEHWCLKCEQSFCGWKNAARHMMQQKDNECHDWANRRRADAEARLTSLQAWSRRLGWSEWCFAVGCGRLGILTGCWDGRSSQMRARSTSFAVFVSSGCRTWVWTRRPSATMASAGRGASATCAKTTM